MFKKFSNFHLFIGLFILSTSKNHQVKVNQTLFNNLAMFGDFSTVIVEPKRTREMLFSLKNVELIVSIVHLYLRQKRVHLLVNIWDI